MSGGVLVATFFFQCGVLGGGWGGLCTWRVLRNMTKKKKIPLYFHVDNQTQ